MDINNLASDYFFRSGTTKVPNRLGELKDTENWGFLYDLIFAGLLHFNRDGLRVLELGISSYANAFGEGSGHAFANMPWVDFFVGTDVLPLYNPLPEGHLFFQVDCNEQESIDILAPYSPFNLIIQDSDHRTESQIFFFKKYRDLLNKPGIMLVENVPEPEKVIEEVGDSSLHIVKVPYLCTWATQGVMKINL